MQEPQVWSLSQEDPLEMEPTPVLLPRKSHGRGVWWTTVHGVTKESDTTQWLNQHQSLCLCLVSSMRRWWGGNHGWRTGHGSSDPMFPYNTCSQGTKKMPKRSTRPCLALGWPRIHSWACCSWQFDFPLIRDKKNNSSLHWCYLSPRGNVLWNGSPKVEIKFQLLRNIHLYY